MPNEWKKTWHLPVADRAIIYEKDTDGRPRVYVNRDIAGGERLYADLFSDSTNLTRDGLVDDSYLDAFNLALTRDHLLQSIGNLTIVKRELNSRMGNRPFPKRQEDLSVSNLRLNREICEHEAWDVNEIHDRTEKLIAYFYKIWPSLDWFAENIV